MGGEIAQLGKKDGTVRLTEQRRTSTGESDLWLGVRAGETRADRFSRGKSHRIGRRSAVARYDGRTVVERLNLERLRANAREAAEQTGRLSLPELHALAPLHRAYCSQPGRPAVTSGSVRQSGTAPSLLAAQLARRTRRSLGGLIGPEGGFADSELDALRATPLCLRRRPGAAGICAPTPRRSRRSRCFRPVSAIGALVGGPDAPVSRGFQALCQALACGRRPHHRPASACRVSRRRLQAGRRMADRHRAREIRVPPSATLRPSPYEGPRGIARC